MTKRPRKYDGIDALINAAGGAEITGDERVVWRNGAIGNLTCQAVAKAIEEIMTLGAARDEVLALLLVHSAVEIGAERMRARVDAFLDAVEQIERVMMQTPADKVVLLKVDRG